MALLTHSVSGLSLSSTTLKCSPPSGAGNWPAITPPSNWAAVMYRAVGRSTTRPSIWPFLSASIARSLVS